MPCSAIQPTQVNGNERSENGAKSNVAFSFSLLPRSLFAHLQNIDFHRFSIIVLFGAKKTSKIKLRFFFAVEQFSTYLNTYSMNSHTYSYTMFWFMAVTNSIKLNKMSSMRAFYTILLSVAKFDKTVSSNKFSYFYVNVCGRVCVTAHQCTTTME